METIRINKHNITITVIIFASLGLRLFFVEKQPYWLDEAYTSWFAHQSYYDLLFWVPTFESHPPFYYVVIKIWNQTVGQFLNSSERYFSLFISIFLFYTSYKISNHLNTNENRTISNISIILFVGFSSIISWYSIEARPYMVFMLSFSIALYGFFLIITENNHISSRSWLILSLGALLTNWSHSTGPIHSFVVYAALTHYCFVSRNNIHIRYLIYSILSVFILSLPLIYIIAQQLQGWSTGSWIKEPTVSTLYHTFSSLYTQPSLKSLISRVFTEGQFATFLSVLLKMIVPALFIFGLYSIIKEKQRNILYLVVFAFSAPVINYIISKAGPNILLDRTLTPVLIPFYLILSISIARIGNSRIKYLLLSILFIQLSLGTYSQFKYSEKEPWDKISNLIAEITEKNDLILLLPNSLKLAVTKTENKTLQNRNIVSLPFEYPAIGKSKFYPAGTPSVPGFTVEDSPELSNLLAKDFNKVIFVTRAKSLFDPENLIQVELSSFKMKLNKTYNYSNYITVYEYENSKNRAIK